MATRAYRPIDVHDDAMPSWPAKIPPLTAVEIERAFKRLYRFAMGKTLDPKAKIVITSGNRYATRIGWAGNYRCFWLNPDQGWRDFIHHLSHDLDYLMNGTSKHGKHHARFETKLIREVIKRGYLDGKLLDVPKIDKAAAAPEVTPLDIKKRLALDRMARIDELLVQWGRKHQRAVNAMKKLGKERARLVKKVA